MLITQTDIASFTLGVIANLVKAKPLSEEQASDLLRREQNGLGRKHVLELLADQVDKAVERKMKRLLDPEVSVCCLSVRLFVGLTVLVHIKNNPSV